MECHKFYYPPHAGSKQRIKRIDLPAYEQMGIYFAQRKYNGTSCVLYISESEINLWDRHHNELTLYKPTYNMISLFRSLRFEPKKKYVLNGEILHTKALSKITGKQAATHTIVLYDLLYAGRYLNDVPAIKRHDMLHEICLNTQVWEEKKRALVVADKEESHLWFANRMDGEFVNCFDEMFDYHAKTGEDKWVEIEGLMLKHKTGMLLAGDSEKDAPWILKCRKKKDKIYHF